MSRVILAGIETEDFVLAARAVRWLEERPAQKDAILVYGEGDGARKLYVRRNKSSITVSAVS